MKWPSWLTTAHSTARGSLGPNVIPLRKRAPIRKNTPPFRLILARVVLGILVVAAAIVFLKG
jgi:hypothetical protein